MKASLFCVNVILLWIMQSAQTKLFYKMIQIKHFIQKSSLKEIGQQFTKTTCKKKHNVLPGAVSTAAATNWT